MYITTTMCDGVLHCLLFFMFFWCPAIRHRVSPSFFGLVYRVTQLRTDGVHCRESAGTGLINLKVVPNECCLGRSPWDQLICASLSDTHSVV